MSNDDLAVLTELVHEGKSGEWRVPSEEAPVHIWLVNLDGDQIMLTDRDAAVMLNALVSIHRSICDVGMAVTYGNGR